MSNPFVFFDKEVRYSSFHVLRERKESTLETATFRQMTALSQKYMSSRTSKYYYNGMFREMWWKVLKVYACTYVLPLLVEKGLVFEWDASITHAEDTKYLGYPFYYWVSAKYPQVSPFIGSWRISRFAGVSSTSALKHM